MGFLQALLTSLILTFGLNGNVPFSTLEKAIESNNSKQIVNMSKPKVMIKVLGTEGVYGHSQAELVLKDFFKKHPGDSFTYTYKGKPTSQGAFAIGNYKSGSDQYRITVQFKKIGENYMVESFSIEK